MQNNKFLKFFNKISEFEKQSFENIKQLKNEGKKIVGTYCTFAPTELIIAADAIPIRLWGISEETIPNAEKYLPKNLCPLIKSSFGSAITNKSTYFNFADLLIGETTCDGKKKMYEYLGEIKPMHIMQLPQRSIGDITFEVWKDEIMLLKSRLEKEFNVQITHEKLKKAIIMENKKRKALNKLFKLSTNCPPPISGKDIYNILFDIDSMLEQEKQIKNILELIASLERECNNNISKTAPRILVTGCPSGGATEKIVNAIEGHGGVVVCYENCRGIKSIENLVDENKDPIDALTEKYLNIPCSVMTPNNNRETLLSNLIDEYKIDGVVDVVLQACHTYNVEALEIKNFIQNKKNISYMLIETDYSQSDTGQINTRIEAFLEMLLF